ncbi:MAG: hypothetical protein M3331_03980 [Actinomycetota bacterium]|nr:hypothetical protein [Actinomycetota bacterium]
MARALIVGCGCLGLELAGRLEVDGWAVRGTSRTERGAERIESRGFDGVVADPDRVGTVLEHVGDVAVVVWALGGTSGASAADVNGPRLGRMLERLVDTPVRGFVLDAHATPAGAKVMVADATRTWRIPSSVVEVPREQSDEWVEAVRAAVNDFLAPRG